MRLYAIGCSASLCALCILARQVHHFQQRKAAKSAHHAMQPEQLITRFCWAFQQHGMARGLCTSTSTQAEPGRHQQARPSADCTTASRPGAATTPTPWERIKSVLFPIKSTDAYVSETPSTSNRTPTQLPRSAAARSAPHVSTRPMPNKAGSAAAHGGHFKPLSAGGEQFVAGLFKYSMLLITIPLAGYVISKSLLIGQLINGLQSRHSQVQKMSLRRLRTYLFCDFLADKFEEADGVMLLANMLNERDTADLMPEYLDAVQHLMSYQSTKQAMLMAMVVERMEQALTSGWIPPQHRDRAHQLYLDLHAARRVYMEETYGVTDPGLAKPVVRVA